MPRQQSPLTIRRYVPATDATKLSAFTAANRPNAADLAEENWYCFVAEENGAVVGITTGRANPGGDTCRLYIVTAVGNRKDVILALLERQAQNGIDTGHTYADAVIPAKGNCTNLGGTPLVTAALDSDVGLKFVARGMDTTTAQAAEFVTHPELKPLRERLKAVLDGMKCVRVWA